jgi:hypothetical protein
MKVSELISQLSAMPPEAEVHAAYDSDIVVTTPNFAELMETESQIGSCWWRVEVGDIVLVSKQK